MQSSEVRSKFLKFFENRGHKIVPSSSLVPNDPTVLFTTAGMQQFKPYYTNPQNADKDFGNRNITTVQKCIRTGDIDEVGDATHLTFFEMLGNFSFGGYGKKKAIEYAHEFITKELKLPISYVTVFDGSKGLVEDEESIEIWESLGIPKDKIIKQGIDDVFWGPTGDSGPCGPTTEIYCKNANGEDVEIWNIVFNQFFSKTSREQAYISGWQLEDLKILGIDTGMGLERLTATVQKKQSVYETDLFENLIKIVIDFSDSKYEKSARIIADHIKASIFMIGDGVLPGPDRASYVLRKLIRKAVRKSLILKDIDPQTLFNFLFREIKEIYKHTYEIFNNEEEFEKIRNILLKETKDVMELDSESPIIIKKTIEEYLAKNKITPMRAQLVVPGRELIPAYPLVPGKVLFDLITTKGIDKEMLIDYLEELGNGYVVPEHSLEELEILLKKHQELSRTSSAGMFKGGLVNHHEKTIKLHTTHHLLLAGLQAVVDKNIKQRGSNITEERLRMDFLCDHKLTDEEKKKVEDWVNNKIKEGLNVVYREMPLLQAEKLGAEMEFGTKYPDIVSIYFIEDKNGNFISKEFCGGPHISNTKELGQFKIQKEEAVAQGIRRIKAVLI